MASMRDSKRRGMRWLPTEKITDAEGLKNALSFQNINFSQGKGRLGTAQETFYLYHLDGQNDGVWIPRNTPKRFEALQGNEIDETTQHTTQLEIVQPSFCLRTYQQSYFDSDILPALQRDETDFVMEVCCGGGKSLMALYLTALRKQKTLILVTQNALVDQFLESAEFLFGDGLVGRFDPKNPDITYPITISTYSLMSQDKWGEKFFSKFGHMIFDEGHRAGADSYLPILEKSNSRYRTTLTATFRRRDGLHEGLAMHCGKRYKMERPFPAAQVFPLTTGVTITMEEISNYYKTPASLNSIKRLDRFKIEFPDGRVKYGSVDQSQGFTYLDGEKLNGTGAKLYKLNKDQGLSSAKLDTILAEHPTRLQIVKELVEKCLNRGRVTLVLSRRKETLFSMALDHRKIGIKAGVIVSKSCQQYREYCRTIGETPDQHKKFCSEEADVIFGIDKIAEEGLDIPRLDTLILMHQLKDIEQAKGRTERLRAGKKYPTMIYLIDDNILCTRRWEGVKEQCLDLDSEVHPVMSYQTFLRGV